jgi:hypothetical protein
LSDHFVVFGRRDAAVFKEKKKEDKRHMLLTFYLTACLSLSLGERHV